MLFGDQLDDFPSVEKSGKKVKRDNFLTPSKERKGESCVMINGGQLNRDPGRYNLGTPSLC